MKRKAVTALLGGALTAAVWAGSAQAMTYSYDLGEENGSRILYILEPEQDQTQERTEIAEEAFTGFSEEERKKLADWHKQEMREQVAYLEIYGISYDADRDRLLYKGKTVRWLIDEQIDNTYMAIQMPEGEIDVYTVREDDHRLSGVRIATQEEYDERTRKEEEAKAAAEAMENQAGVYAEEDGSVIHTFVYDDSVMADCESTAAAEITEGSALVIEDTVSEGDELDEQFMAKRREYGTYGIGYDGAAGWTWRGKAIYLLMDEDGGLYQNGSEEAKENKIYIVVKRDADGSVSEVKQMTVEEVMAERIAAENN